MFTQGLPTTVTTTVLPGSTFTLVPAQVTTFNSTITTFFASTPYISASTNAAGVAFTSTLNTTAPSSSESSLTTSSVAYTAPPNPSAVIPLRSSQPHATSPSSFQASPAVTSSQVRAVSSSPTSSSGIGREDSGYSAAVLGGAIAGTAVGTALLCILISLCCFWHRKRNFSHSDGKTSGFAAVSEKEISNETSAQEASARRTNAWQQHLPQPEDDATMRNKATAMLDQITLHVDNYYVDRSVVLTANVKANLEKFDFGNSSDSIISMIERTSFPLALIKHCMVSEIIARISSTRGYAETFLPEDFVALPQAMQAAGARAEPRALYQALSQWRVLTTYLRPAPLADHSYVAQAGSIIDMAAESLVQAFAPWAIEALSVSERQQKLTAVMRSAAQTGILIFSQPSTFTFRWVGTATSQSNRKDVEVTPSFVKTRDEEARELSRAQILVPSRTESI